jgi:hypothetical protein
MRVFVLTATYELRVEKATYVTTLTAPVSATSTVRKSKAVCPSRTKSNLPGHSPPAVSGQPSIGLIYQ